MMKWENSNTQNTILVRLILLPFLVVFLDSAFAQDDLRRTFFKETDLAKEAADTVDAKLFAPRSYADGSEDYESAEDALQRSGSIEYVRRKASEAKTHYHAAKQIAESTKTILAQVMKSREDAANAEAPSLAPEVWDKAQRAFAGAILALERGDQKIAQRSEVDAVNYYRDAELIAIKAQYLTETRNLLQDAERARVSRYAPITLGRAKQLLADAERELNENRYDTDIPRSLARQANYEAKHAIYLSKIIRDVRARNLTIEELILHWEKPLENIAGMADIVPFLAAGYEELEQDLLTYIEDQRNTIQSTEQELESNILRLADMEEEIRTLDKRLGGATAERAALVQRLEAEDRIKAQFERVEKMFSRDEARVFREGDTIILRVVGLTFESAKAEIKQADFDLLAKIEKAIDVFPRSELVIEGHTDSYGGDQSNQRLSQERAEAIQQYMINAMRIPSYRLIATGFGETNPVANNETESGRARNRRIDIVIKPNLEPI